MIQRICAIILFSCLYGLATAQQMPNNTLFDWNKINFNPAFSGTSNTTDIIIQTRQQWIGFENAPRSQYILANAMLEEGIGVGGLIFNNVAGPTKQTGFKAAFSKHMHLNRNLSFALAISIDMYQNFYDKERLKTGLPDDPAITYSTLEQKIAPDASFGTILYTTNYYIGFSTTNITESRYDFFSTTNDFSNPYKRMYHLNGGYTQVLDKETKISSSFLLKKTIGLPYQIDVSARFYYDFLITGLSYNLNNDVSVIAGAQFAKFYEIVYAYDYSFGEMGNYSQGNHEIVLRFKLENKNNRAKYMNEWF
ncbi:MAG TPA: PorP/SprF family type IX secretion system membrane protein [Bacteroidales bacterium]|nr:PorP/SprF family type IX secretion system membrane protein [Bacteroidales bacterium]